MTTPDPLMTLLEAANAASPFHAITGFRILSAGAGEAVVVFDARPELMNHAAALHAGVQCAALDTAAGYAAASLAGAVVTLQMTTSFLNSAKGSHFRAAARVAKDGRAQMFVTAELFVERDGKERLVATASAVLAKP